MCEVIEHLNTTANGLQNQINFISLSDLCESSIFHLEFDGTAVIQLYFLPFLIIHYLPWGTIFCSNLQIFFFSIKILIKSLCFQIIRPRLSYCTFFVDFCIWCLWQRFGNGGTARVASVRPKGCPTPDTDSSRQICIGLTTGHSCTYQ